VLCKILGLFETESHNRVTGKKVFKQLVREGGREGGREEGRVGQVVDFWRRRATTG